MGNTIVSDEIIVVDLEGTCWVTQPRSTNRDIIEIGVCVLHTHSGIITRAANVLVRPTSSRIGLYCQFVTDITPERAEGGMEFRKACEWLQAEFGATMPWAAWGSWDRAQLTVQCDREKIAYPLSPDHIDIKLFVSDCFGWRKPKSLGKALSALGMQFQGRKHHAMDDSINEARVFHQALLRR